MCPNMLLPTRQGGQSFGGAPPVFWAGFTGPSPRREAAGDRHTICTLNENRDKAARGLQLVANVPNGYPRRCALGS